jgi:hypothetical protein
MILVVRSFAIQWKERELKSSVVVPGFRSCVGTACLKITIVFDSTSFLHLLNKS